MTQSNSWRRLRGGEGVGREGKKGVERVSKMKNCGNRVEWSFNSPLSPDSRKFDYSPGGLRGRLRENSKRQLCSLSYEFCTNLYAGKGFEEGGRGGREWWISIDRFRKELAAARFTRQQERLFCWWWWTFLWKCAKRLI